MTTIELDQTGPASGSLDPAVATSAGGQQTEASEDHHRCEPTAGSPGSVSPAAGDALDREQKPERKSVKFDAYANWRRQARAGRGGMPRSTPTGAGRSEHREKARPERWMSEEEKQREKERSRSAAAFFREALYGNESGKCELGAVLRSAPGECGMFCAFCSSSRPCRLSLRS